MRNCVFILCLCCFVGISMSLVGCGEEDGSSTSTNGSEDDNNGSEDDNNGSEDGNNGSEDDNNSSENESECYAPIGTYSQEVVNAGGDCSIEFVNAVTGTFDVEMDEDDSNRACGTYNIMDTYTEQFDNGVECTSTFSGADTVTADGLEDTSFTYEQECDNGEQCEHEFNVYYTKR